MTYCCYRGYMPYKTVNHLVLAGKSFRYSQHTLFWDLSSDLDKENIEDVV